MKIIFISSGENIKRAWWRVMAFAARAAQNTGKKKAVHHEHRQAGAAALTSRFRIVNRFVSDGGLSVDVDGRCRALRVLRQRRARRASA